MCRTNIAQIILSSFDKVVLSHSSSTKGRTIRKLMGGKGRAKYKKNIRARENSMKKNHTLQLTPKKYSCYGLKKIHTRKIFLRLENPPPPTPCPHNFSNGPSLRSSDLTKVVYHLPPIPGNSCWDVNGKRFYGSSQWKIPGTNGNSERVVPFSRLGRSS